MKTKFLVLTLFLLLVSSCSSNNKEQLTSSAIQETKQINENPNINLEGPFLVARIIDGDTLEINSSYKIRLSGINTPETGECYYQEAKQFLSSLTLNQEIYLERDITNKDVYGRFLRYIYIQDDLINSILVEEGYAKVYDKYANDTKRYQQLKRIEDPAKTNMLGVWSCPETNTNCLFLGSKNSDKYYKPGCKTIKRIKPENLICYNSTAQVKKLTEGNC
ncbi:MAG TPA: thermonuclease family protein [Candidatus Nanoarchaeia archaeon]|nr:thermonuclease family protein [Candidatus Nanoarchaeia archaeon]